MSNPNNDRNFWRESFALGSLGEAIEMLDMLIEADASKTVHLYNPLWVSFVIAYCRPFTNSDLGAIPSKLVPREFAAIHEVLMNVRNKMLGHSDSTERASNGNQVNRLQIKISGGYFKIQPHRLMPVPVSLTEYRSLTLAVFENLTKEADRLFHGVEGASTLSDGVYTFDHTQPVGQRWHREAML